MKKKKDQNLTIGSVSKLKNINAQTLRYYDKIGILSPVLIDPDTNYRYYSKEQLILIDKIKFLKILGLSLEEISEFQKISDLTSVVKNLKDKKRELENKINKLKLIDKDLSSIISTLEDVEKRKKEDNLSIHIGSYEEIHGILAPFDGRQGWLAFEEFLGELTKENPLYSDINHNYGVSFIADEKDMINTSDANIKSVIIPIRNPSDNIDLVSKYPLGRCIVGYHMGEFKKLNNIYNKLRAYIKDNKLVMKGDFILTPLINSFITSEKKDFILEIKIPIIN